MPVWSAELKELEKLHESIRGQLPDLEKELERLIKADDENMILLYSRRCLEVIITDLCECELKRPRKTEPLQGIIDKLLKEEKVPSNIIASMHGLNELSTFGAHPKDFDPKQVRTTLINLETIIEWYIKHRNSGAAIAVRPYEEIRQEIESAEKIRKSTTIPKKRLAGIISVIIAVILIVFVVLYLSNKELEKSIAVLPFINESPVDSNRHFINGIKEEILNNLQTIKEFRVLSRTSTDKYLGPDRPTIPEIAKKLNVSYVVEGSGQKFGNTFILRVQLIRGKGKENHLWAKSFEQEIKEVKDYIKIQSQIAQSIATELKTTIIPEEKQLIENTPTVSLTALDLYQKGRNEHVKYWGDNKKITALDSAVTFYKLALKSDSTFAQAYLGLANARANYYWRDVNIKWKFSADEMKLVKDSIMSLVDKALYFNKNLEEAYLWRGSASENEDLAIKEYRKALEINPNCSDAYDAISWILFENKRESIEAIKYKLKAIELEKGPNLAQLLADLGNWYEVFGFNGNAIEIYNQLLPLTNDTLQYFQNMSGPFYAQKDWEESIRWAKKILRKDPNHIWAHYQLAEIYLFIGKDDSSSYHTERIIELGENREDFKHNEIKLAERTRKGTYPA